MHPRHLGDGHCYRQLTLNFEFLFEIFCIATCMFPYEDSKILSVCLYPEKINHPIFVNIGHTLVIDTSMERSSQVLATAWKPKNLIFYQKRLKLNFDLCWRAEITLASSISVQHYYLVPTSMERSSRVLYHVKPKI